MSTGCCDGIVHVCVCVCVFLRSVHGMHACVLVCVCIDYCNIGILGVFF